MKKRVLLMLMLLSAVLPALLNAGTTGQFRSNDRFFASRECSLRTAKRLASLESKQESRSRQKAVAVPVVGN